VQRREDARLHGVAHVERRLDLRESLGETMQTLGFRAHQKGLELVYDVRPDVPPAMLGDPGRLRQVLVNLVGNALKYSPPGSSVVMSGSADGDWLTVSVEDEGVGIPESERALVAEPFHRAWNVRESRIPGTGLGLFICRRLVEAHGGRLSIGDRLDGGPGTRVSFTLPLVRSEGNGRG